MQYENQYWFAKKIVTENLIKIYLDFLLQIDFGY